MIAKARKDENNERLMIALQMSSRHYFRIGSEGLSTENSKFDKLFDQIANGIIDQSNKNPSLDLVLDRKGGRHSILKG